MVNVKLGNRMPCFRNVLCFSKCYYKKQEKHDERQEKSNIFLIVLLASSFRFASVEYIWWCCSVNSLIINYFLHVLFYMYVESWISDHLATVCTLDVCKSKSWTIYNDFGTIYVGIQWHLCVGRFSFLVLF